MVLTLHETVVVRDGMEERQRVTLMVDAEGDLVLGDGQADVVLPYGLLFKVFERYGKPLDSSIALPQQGLDLGGGVQLFALRHLARFDVIAKDYVVLSRPGEEPLCELSVSIAGALSHLAHLAR